MNADSICFAFIRFNLGFRSEARRAKHELQFHRRPDSNETIWFVALSKEQLTLITENWLHELPFVNG
jgi:hypothetical protein